jgi:transmembrane sensor
LEKYIAGGLSEGERRELFESLDDEEQAEKFRDVILRLSQEFQTEVSYNSEDWKPMVQQILAHRQQSKTIRASFRKFWWAAAAIIILLGGGALYYLNNSKQKQEASNQVSAQDIPAPKTNRATITLANGKQLFLDSVANGTLATQGSIQIKKTGDGVIAYNGKQQIKNELVYNSLTNPRGSKVIDITLSDGTRVWLNAESSLKYPVAFTGTDRQVEITGEAYFEVKHDAAKSFKVKTKNSIIEDIGTAFNIKAYSDEGDERMTLLQGAVNVALATAGTKTASQRRLSPGEQALVEAGSIAINEKADIEQVLAWKNGLFNFNSSDIQTVMRELSRWYDIDIAYEGTPTSDKFGGGITRTVNLNQILQILQSSKVHFKLEGRKLTVLP